VHEVLLLLLLPHKEQHEGRGRQSRTCMQDGVAGFAFLLPCMCTAATYRKELLLLLCMVGGWWKEKNSLHDLGIGTNSADS
jgi:hypothetical protein